MLHRQLTTIAAAPVAITTTTTSRQRQYRRLHRLHTFFPFYHCYRRSPSPLSSNGDELTLGEATVVQLHPTFYDDLVSLASDRRFASGWCAGRRSRLYGAQAVGRL